MSESWEHLCQQQINILLEREAERMRLAMTDPDNVDTMTIPEWVMKIVRCGDPSYDHIHTLICADLFNGVAQECEHEAANALSAFTSDVLLEISARYRAVAAQLRGQG